jgi:hypothetical protein
MFIFIITLALTLTAHSAGWNPANNPFKLGSDFKSKAIDLPRAGGLIDERLGWPGNHWASYIGGIAHRWSSGNPQNFTYKLLGLDELRKLEPHQLAELSPAEKFDIFNGNYNYPTVKNVLGRISPNESEWHGICHGYAPAALNHPEPASITLINPDGLSVHFYSSDVAGLMSFYYANIASTQVTLIGGRCNYNASSRIPRRSQSSCEDLNAGAFHLVVANKLGLKGIGFIADIDRYSEVWNHIAVSFKTTYRYDLAPANTSAFGTTKRLHVETVVTYAAAIPPKFKPVLNTEAAEYAHSYYEYYLDLDKNGEIIGGDWISDARPDFVWTQKPAPFVREWATLNQVFNPSAI